MGTPYLRFQTRIVQVPALRLDQFRDTANRVALSFTPNMAGSFDRVEQVIRVAMGFRDRQDLTGYRKFFAFWVVEGRLQTEDQYALDRRLKEMEMPEIIDWWRQEGIELGKAEGMRQKALEDARRMREHGIAWDVVTDITGVKPEDLEAK